MNIMPSQVYITLEINLCGMIHKMWRWRKEDYWRNELKKQIAALRYIRNK